MRVGFLFILLIVFGRCSPDTRHTTLESYASELPKAIKNGPNIIRYVSKTKDKAPDVRVSICYNDLLSKWNYLPDPPNYDHFINVESVFKTGIFVGDCEDFAATIMAICRNLNLKCQIALGENNSKGHAWAELQVYHSKPTLAILKRIQVLFGNSVSYIHRSNGTWVQMSPEGTLLNYKTQYLISSKGVLQRVK